MKNKLLTLLALSSISLASIAGHHHLDSVLTETHVNNGTNLMPYIRQGYQVDGQCRNNTSESYTSLNVFDSTWNTPTYILYTYDGQNNIATKESPNNYKNAYTHSSGLLSEVITQFWISNTSSYRNSYRLTYHYSANQKPDSVYTQDWDTVGNSWLARHLSETRSYDGQNNLASLAYYGFSAGNSTNLGLSLYSYTATNKLDVEKTLSWNNSQSRWDTTSQSFNFYDGSDRLYNVTKIRWNSGSGSWDYSTKRDLEYNNDNDVTVEWDSVYTQFQNPNHWDISAKITNYYGCALTVNGINEAAADKISLYPNPTSGIIQLDLNTESDNKILTITDMNSKTLQTQMANKGLNTINVTNLATGLYLLSWQMNGETITKKFMKD